MSDAVPYIQWSRLPERGHQHGDYVVRRWSGPDSWWHLTFKGEPITNNGHGWPTLADAKMAAYGHQRGRNTERLIDDLIADDTSRKLLFAKLMVWANDVNEQLRGSPRATVL